MTPRTKLFLLLVVLVLEGSSADTRYFLKMRTNASDSFKTRNDGAKVLGDVGTVPRNPLREDTRFSSLQNDGDDERSKDEANSQTDGRNSVAETSTFDPDVLNKFLEDYANKMKGSTDRNLDYPFGKGKPTSSEFPADLEVDEDDKFPSTLPTTTTKRLDQTEKSAADTTGPSVDSDEPSQVPGDSLKRNKYWGMNSPSDERNGNGWVTLDAIPWSKSKISKWQANPSTQRPWPEIKPWSKPSGAKPWQTDYPSRPLAYDHNEPSWYDRPKPQWAENNALEKPWTKPSRPSYYGDDHSNQNQQNDKWPPERPSWDSHGAHSDIITDDRPTNFPGSYPWNRPNPGNQLPTYGNDYGNRRPEENNGDWQDFPSRYDSNRRRPTNRDRPSHFSQYQYSNGHPPTHPANGDGQWVLLSTNRGYSKSRQRSIKLDGPNTYVALATTSPTSTVKSKDNKKKNNNEPDNTVAVMTSKRQVRLTVLPSINGTNTTTSHGGLLEVERTFKSVDQSRKEYERDKKLGATQPTFLAAKPLSGIAVNGRPSSSAVLAAVGAGMLPATMAMMIPMMLGRRKRDTNDQPLDVDRPVDNRHAPTRNVKAR